MADQQKEPPRPHGDPLGDVAPDTNPEDNRAQRQSDAPPDPIGGRRDGNRGEQSERDGDRGSDANGIPAFDEADGKRRRKQYDEGADLVSGID